MSRFVRVRRWLLGGLLAGVGLLVALVAVGLWGSRGHLPAFIAGQLAPKGPPLDDAWAGPDPPPGVERIALRVELDPTRVLRRVDPRYLSFAVDTSAVVGGKWWDPDAEGPEVGSGTVEAPVFDFDRPRLVALARALAPAYLRIGGSEADKLYYHTDRGEPPPRKPPPGYHSVLTPVQWDGVHRFARRAGLDVVMTLNAGPSSRDPNGRWRSENAEALIASTHRQGQRVAIWELGNELNLFWYIHGVTETVGAEQYQDDLRRLRQVVGENDPGALVAGQGAAFWPVLGEPLGLFFGFQDAYARCCGGMTEIFSWHYYPQQSRRGPIASRRAHPRRLLDPGHLDEVAHWADHNAALRDRFSPGTPLWLGETGHAQFGGEPGLSDRFLASLWWVDQLGLLARHHHDVVVRQTLAGSNYQLVASDTLEPLPDYWASVLWKGLMGADVLELRRSGPETARVYAHRAPGGTGATLLVVNLDPRRVLEVALPEALEPARVYAVTAPDLFGTETWLNRAPLALEATGGLPPLEGAPAEDPLVVAPLSYAFVSTASTARRAPPGARGPEGEAEGSRSAGRP